MKPTICGNINNQYTPKSNKRPQEQKERKGRKGNGKTWEESQGEGTVMNCYSLLLLAKIQVRRWDDDVANGQGEVGQWLPLAFD